VFAFCLSRLGSREEAEDAVQSTFLNAHRALGRGVSPDSELAWLLKIAHNVCLTRRRSTRRRGRVEAAHDLEAMQDYLPAPSQEPADELITLTDALEHLPESQRRAILLREWQGLSYAEIARELKVTQSAVETLIFRARRALAANLEMVVVKPRLLARARHALDLGWLLPGLKALFGGGVAVKAATAAVAVSTAAVIATSPAAPTQHAPRASAPPPASIETPIAQPSSPVERPRMRERLDVEAAAPAPSAVRARRAVRTGATRAVEKPSKASVQEKKVKHEPRVAVVREKKTKPEPRVKPTPAKAKVQPKPKPKPAKPEKWTKPRPTPPAKVQGPAAAAPPEKAKPEPEPANGKNK
jgi:RNA polymerase sigma factor (sigma-70 family)